MFTYQSIWLDKNSDTPLYRQLGEALRAMIEQGAVEPNSKLPPIRKMADALSVNNMTVISAYKYLESKKVVYSVVGSGTYVSPLTSAELPEPILKNQYNANVLLHDNLTDAINFADTSTDVALFPVDAFKQAFNAVLERDRGLAFDYQESQGYAPLRQSLCAYMAEWGIRTAADRIQIISGAQQGIDIIAKVLLSPGDVVFVEKPTFYGAVGAFFSRGAQIVEVDLESDGPDMNRLEALLKVYKPKLIYVMPSYQTPTGICYSMDKKRMLLDWACRYETYLIEEDNQNDFYYGGQPGIPIKALDYKNRVIYIKSFSKILMPGLRIGAMALPKKIALQTASVKHNTDIATSGFIQRAFDLYLQGGEFKKHCAKMRQVYGRRYRALLAAADALLSPHVHYVPSNGGLSLWMALKNNKQSMEALCNRFMRRKVIVTPGDVFSMNGGDIPYFRISFAALEEKKIADGIRIMAALLQEAVSV